MTTDPKPYLLIDVDGVLAPVVEEAAPASFARHKVKASTGEVHEVWLNPAHGVWLNSLHKRFELVWVTGWENDAPRLLGPILRLPPMRVIEFAQRPDLNTPLRKLPDVREFVGDAPTAWIDDDLDSEAHHWANRRIAPTLLIQTNRAVGLTSDHVRQLGEFSRRVASAQRT